VKWSSWLRGRLTWKYVAVLVSLVVAALLASGLTEAYFSYQDNRRALNRIHLEKASSAASLIEQFIEGLHNQLSDVARSEGLGERNIDFQRLLVREGAVSTVRYLDSSGREQLRISRYSVNHEGPGPDYAGTPAFRVARAQGTYYGRLYFLRDSRPHLTLSVRERPPGRGVVVAEIDLQFVEGVIKQARVGSAGYAYAVDSHGQLVAHPSIDLVLGRADFVRLPQVRSALSGSARTATSAVATGRNWQGRKVLSAFQTVDPPGWRVFVEEPLSVAYSPLESALVRTALLLVAFLALAVGVSVLLARRMVRPIASMQVASARIGEGALDHRIEVTRKDELGMLAEEFNRMAARLQESYAGLEEKVEERTQELGTALAELDEKSRQLETVSRHKSEFLANMSHELRTPLNAIIGFSDVLREQMFGELNEQQLGYVDDVLEAGRHLLSLINDVLDLSKVEAGRMELELSEVSLPETLRSGLTMHEEHASRSRVTLALAVDPEEILVQADERKVRQVVFNLLSNAVKFTPPGGRVDVTAQMTNGVVEVAVADTGSGIAREDQEMIFEEFQQARGKNGSEHEGTGLGLPLARSFIELHGGRLWVESAPGEGSTFRFTLPVRHGS
jgi:two-component system NtrC family sensor kinase